MDPDEVGQWADEEVYAEMVRVAEREIHADHRLSQVLADRDTRDLARVIHLYSLGKISHYGRVLDYFENK